MFPVAQNLGNGIFMQMMPAMNFSHAIHKLSFGEDFPRKNL
jgi:hypothetical protein